MSDESDKSMEQESQESPTKEQPEKAAEQSNGKTEEDSKEENEDTDKASPQKKTPQKRKVEDKEDEDEEDESSDEEPQLGSVEAPVQIMTGKRERKKTERLVFEETKKPQEKMDKIEAGKGTKLCEIPNVNYYINKTNAEFLKPVNQLLFGFMGKTINVKKNIRQFSGFPFGKDDAEYKKKEARLFKFTLVGLKELCTWFDVERGGTKEQICARVMEFLLKPEPSGRPLPEKKKKGAKKTGKKRKRKSKKDGSGDGSGDAKKKSKKQKKAKDEEDGEDAAENSDDSISSLSSDSDEEEEEEKEPKKKKQKVEKKTPKKAATPKKSASSSAKKSKEKKTTPKATPKKKEKTPAKKATPKKPVSSVSSDSSDDEPLVKKKSAPTEAQIKDTIKKFLEKANLEEVTMKTVCKKVYETYPDFDLTHKKDFIKSTVKSIIS